MAVDASLVRQCQVVVATVDAPAQLLHLSQLAPQLPVLLVERARSRERLGVRRGRQGGRGEEDGVHGGLPHGRHGQERAGVVDPAPTTLVPAIAERAGPCHSRQGTGSPRACPNTAPWYTRAYENRNMVVGVDQFRLTTATSRVFSFPN